MVTADFEERSPSARDEEPGAVVWELGAGYVEQGPRGQAEMIGLRDHISAMHLDLSDEEATALVDLLKRAIAGDLPYSPSPRAEEA